MTLHPSGNLPLSQATSLSFLPTGIINNLNLSAINTTNYKENAVPASTATSSEIKVIPYNKVSINSNSLVTPVVSVKSSSTSKTTSSLSKDTTYSKILLASKPQNSELSSTSLISLSNFINSTSLGLNVSNTNTRKSISAQYINTTANSSIIVSNATLPTSVSTTVTHQTPSSTSVIVSAFPHQPLVQPQLLQQQQQQILQMIQQQHQPQMPQQRLASHLPIKVPQYTASHLKPIVSASTVQVIEF